MWSMFIFTCAAPMYSSAGQSIQFVTNTMSRYAGAIVFNGRWIHTGCYTFLLAPILDNLACMNTVLVPL